MAGDSASPLSSDALPDTFDRAEHRRALRAYFSRRRVRTADDIEDHVQDVYLRVIAAGLTRKPVSSWRGVLLRVASSVLIDRLRRGRVRESEHHVGLEPDHDLADDGACSPEAATLAAEKLEQIEHLLMGMDPIRRQVFVLARLEGMPHREIAARLGIETVSVGRHVEAALIQLVRHTADGA